MPTTGGDSPQRYDSGRLSANQSASPQAITTAADPAAEALSPHRESEGYALPNDPSLLLNITGAITTTRDEGLFFLGRKTGGFHTRGLTPNDETDPVSAEQLEVMLAESDPRLENGIYVVPFLSVIDDTLIPLERVSHALHIGGSTTPISEIGQTLKNGRQEIPCAFQVDIDSLPDYFRIRKAEAAMIKEWKSTPPPLSETLAEKDLYSIADIGFHKKDFKGLYLDPEKNTVTVDIDRLTKLPIGLRLRPNTSPYQTGTIVENSPEAREKLKEQGIKQVQFEVKPEVVKATLAYCEQRANEMRSSMSFRVSKAWKNLKNTVYGAYLTLRPWSN